MTNERLEFRPLTEIKQAFETGCVPTAISMVLSGFGVDVSEEKLINRYFPTARLPSGDPGAGVNSPSILSGIIKVLKDMGLQDRLQVDTFEPDLSPYTSSLEEKYIVKSTPEALRKYGKVFDRRRDEEFFRVFRGISRS